MDRDGARFLAGLGFVLTIIGGVVPLVQWFVFDHRNGLIDRLPGSAGGPWVWVWPLVATSIGIVLMAWFGNEERWGPDAPPDDPST